MNCDVAIFGSGFAAYEVARILMAHHKSIVVIERGTRDPFEADPKRSHVPFRREPIASGGSAFGAHVPSSFDGIPRYIGLGGTSELWSGKWRPLDAVDFARSSVERQWPFSRADMEPHYRAVRAAYGIPCFRDDPEFRPYDEIAGAAGLRLIEIYEETPPIRLRQRWSELQHSGDLTIICSAELKDATTSHDRFVRVCVTAPEGDRAVEATAFVIACGGIETIPVMHRLLGAVSSCTDAGGDERTERRYGGFMDHPKGIFGEFTVRSNQDLLRFANDSRQQNGRLLALSLPEEEVGAAGAGNHTIFLQPPPEPGGDAWRAVINVDQFPEGDNAVIVAAHETTVSWRISHATWSNVARYARKITPRLTSLLGPFSEARRITLCGASHHSGSLPMGTQLGAPVDAECRVAGTENLYCVSSALFPFAGSANPTMTIVAMAHRLAGRLVEGTISS